MRVVAFDTETHLFRPGRMAPPIVCLSWAEEDRSGLVVGRGPIEAWLREHLGQVCLVGHVVAYDAACVLSTFPQLTEQVFDAYGRDLVVCTAVRERLLDIGKGEFNPGEKGRYSLAGIARRRFGQKLDKGADTYRMRYAELDGVPLDRWPRAAVEYAVKDATTTLALARAQEEGELPTQFADSRADFALRLASVWGVQTDPVQVEQLWESTVGRMEALVPGLEAAKLVTSSRLQTEMFAEARRRLPEVRRSTKRLRELVLQTYRGKEQLPRTEKGAIQTTKTVLRDCAFPPLLQLLEFTGLQKAASTYIRKLFAPVVHARFDAVGAASDRTSSSGPNMQNQPRLPGIRECVVARPGHVLLACDFDSQEMRTLAQSCLDIVGHSRLAERYQADRHFDPHTEFAASLAGVSVEEALRLKKEGSVEIKELRQRAKCFHPDTEILTRRRGWVQIGDLTKADEVAAAYPGVNGESFLAWEKPTALTRRPSPGHLIHLKNENINLRVTADHRMLGFIASGQPRVMRPEELGLARFWANAGVMGGSECAPTDAILRLAVATQADGSFAGAGIRFGFSKERKIARMRQLLEGLEGWSEASHPEQLPKPVVSFYIKKEIARNVRRLLCSDKTMPWSWVNLPLRSREIILDEVQHWDGHVIGSGRSYSFSSTIEKNVHVLQAVAAITGRKSRIGAVFKRADDRHADCHYLRISDRSRSRGDSLYPQRVEYTGDVVCLSVPSSFVLVRDGGIPVITGQCSDFGYPGGMGPLKFINYARGYGLELTEAQSRELREGWRKQWPEMAGYFKHVEAVVGRESYGTMVIPRSGFRRGGVGYTDCANGYFQTLAAHAAKEALWDVTRRCFCEPASALFNSRPVLFVHDEIILETPEAKGHEAAQELEAVMVTAMERWTPDVPCAASATLMRRWSKGAEQTYDGGRLIPWEDEDDELGGD